MANVVQVGIADLNVVRAPNQLVTYALGSCVGICLYDKASKIAGLSHIMLPNSKDIPSIQTQVYKFADTAITLLVKKMSIMGANQAALTAKIAGGATMFSNVRDSSLSGIGERNIAAVKAELSKLKIPIVAEDCGLNYGRTQYFDAETGTMTIKAANKPDKVF